MVVGIINLCSGVIIDIHYDKIILSTYISHPNESSYKSFDQCMKILYHHLRIPIIYPRKEFKIYPLYCIFQHVNVEITYINYLIYLESYHDHDYDLSRYLITRR